MGYAYYNKDRIWQNMTKLALEPQWEYIFEPTYYGFRPGRGCHNAMSRIFNSLTRKKKRWIFEGDFKGCFNNLRHDYIMEQIRCFPNKEIIEKWLKSGYIDNNVFNETDRGGDQGSIISQGKHKDRWILSSPNEEKVQFIKMSWTPIRRHTMIKHKATPYNSNLKEYFENRISKNKKLTEGKQVCLSCMF